MIQKITRNAYLLFIGIFFLSSCSLAIHPSERMFREVNDKRMIFDAIIVPGIPLKNGHWDSTMKARVLWSVYLYKNHYTKNIIFSGAAVYTHFYESIVMGLYAQKLGVPKEHIFYDTLAKHSTENIYYSYMVAKQLGFKTLALATDPFQSFLLKGFTKKRFASPIQHIPIQFKIIKKINDIQIDIDSMKAFKPDFNSILNKEPFAKRLKGTLGRQIDYGPEKRLPPL